MTGPEQNRRARPDERARGDERVPDGRAGQRYEESPGRARDDRERQQGFERERQRYDGQGAARAA